MTLKEAALQLGVELPEDWKTAKSEEDVGCTDALIRSLQEKFDLFGPYHRIVQKAFAHIREDRAMSLWLGFACSYYKKADHDHGRDLPVPVTDGSLARDFLPLAVLLPTVETAYENYLKRGFSHEEAVGFLGCIKLNIRIVEERILGRPAITATYFRWLTHYLKCTIFDHGGLNFEIKPFQKVAYYLKNKLSGEIVVLSGRSAAHRCGMPLGSAGFEDEQGSFEIGFEETENAYIGHPVKDRLIQKEKERYAKAEWSLFLAPGDFIINVHIPRGTDLSPDKVKAAYADGRRIVTKRFPEYAPKAFICSSWLMDPTLKEILGADSKIAKFAEPYLRIPNKSAGKEIFSFVFCPKDADDLSALPENTRLERALKEMYLSGKFIYAYTGMMPFETAEKL
ncbi:MAG: hypothetical protein E7580_07450 [Ruminococcaceae bacterium]|nr:hypothetical protein [Oscillospiraceae bacterium]